MRRPCVVCGREKDPNHFAFCDRCDKDYIRKVAGGSMLDGIVWAADRARYFDRRRAK